MSRPEIIVRSERVVGIKTRDALDDNRVARREQFFEREEVTGRDHGEKLADLQSQRENSATELAARIRDKSLSPVELMQSTIARAEALNPRLNAICTETFDAALDQARGAEAMVMRGDTLPPLHGIPTTVKDLALTKGVRTMAGSHVFAERVPDIDHAHVERMRSAGMISIGKTTVSEFGWSGVSNSPLTGITHNPHNGTDVYYPSPTLRHHSPGN